MASPFGKNSFLTTFTISIVIVIAALAIIKALNIAYPIEITSKSTSGELAVVGEGKVDVVPDTASADLGIIVTNASSVNDAQDKINKANNSIVAALKKQGVDKKDIKTSNYSIYPNYDYQKNPSGEIIGYNGNVTITVKVRDTQRLPTVIQEATNAGANQVIGTTYSVDSPEKYREDARDKAIQNAKEQAQKLADSLGIRLGKVVNIVESTSGTTPPVFAREAMGLGSGAAPAPDLQPGSQTITSTVTLYFEKR